MADVSIVIPVANYHKDVAQRAIDSAAAQTAPCITHVIEDKDGRGAGWARNQGLAKVKTHFVIFLDADDWLEPNFAERCLSVIRPNSYVYTDWWQDNVGHEAPPPEKAWSMNGDWHVITTLLETAIVKKAGGFSEQLNGAEDTFFYWHITRHGICGIHIPQPLFHYGKEGRRAKAFVGSGEYKPAMLAIVERYRNMSCCGDPKPTPTEGGQPGDILARAMWLGNRRVIGSISGRVYPRTGNYKVEMVDPRDIQAAPELWRVVVPEPELAPPAPLPIVTMPAVGKVYEPPELAARLFGNGQPAPMNAEQLAQTLSVKPDVSKIRELALFLKHAQMSPSEVVIKEDVKPDKPVAKPKRGRKPKVK